MYYIHNIITILFDLNTEGDPAVSSMRMKLEAIVQVNKPATEEDIDIFKNSVAFYVRQYTNLCL